MDCILAVSIADSSDSSSKVVRALFLISWFPKTPIANSYFGLITTTESKWPFPSSSVTGLV